MRQRRKRANKRLHRASLRSGGTARLPIEMTATERQPAVRSSEPTGWSWPVARMQRRHPIAVTGIEVANQRQVSGQLPDRQDPDHKLPFAESESTIPALSHHDPGRRGVTCPGKDGGV